MNVQMTTNQFRTYRAIRRTIAFFLFLTFVTAACGSTEEPTPTQLPAPPTDIPAPTPSPTPDPSPTPAPTPRPLTESESDENTYLSSLLGVSLDIPSSWEIVSSSDSETQLLEMKAPDSEALAYLTWEYMTEDVNLEETAQTFSDLLWDYFELDDSIASRRSAYAPLADGTPARYHEFQVADGDYAGLHMKVVTAESRGKAFVLMLLSNTSGSAALELEITQMKESLSFEPPRPYGVHRENALFIASYEPETLDPAKHRYYPDSVIGDIYSGLVRIGTDHQIIPDLAESWEVSPDGTTYTFYLRRNATFHTGRQFTADDVLFSLERALDPKTESDTALTKLDDISGAKEYASGETDSISGITVVDEFSIEIELVGPRAYFLHKLSYPASWIVDRETVHNIEENPIGTGPFTMMKHDEDEIIILGRNPTYHMGFVPLEYVVYLMYPGYPLRLYESDEIDLLYIDEDLLERVKDSNDPLHGTAHEITELCTTYLVFDTSKPPFDDPMVRRAFAHVVDRTQLNEIVWEGRGVMAAGLYPPGVPGYNPDAQPIETNPDLAIEVLNSSSYGSATNLPEITFTSSGAGSGVDPDIALLIESWEQTFGIDILLDQLDSDSFYDELYAGNHGEIMQLGWCADYPDPQNFADVLFHSESNHNHGRYSDPELDTAIELARGETDFNIRMDMYRAMEQQIIDDAPAVFLWYSRPFYIVTKPQIQGFVATPLRVPQHMNLWIDRDDQ